MPLNLQRNKILTTELHEEIDVVVALMQGAYDKHKFSQLTLQDACEAEENGECMSMALMIFLENYSHLNGVWRHNK